MATDRQPGELRPGDRVVTLHRTRETGRIASIEGDTAQVVFDGIEGKSWPVPLAKLARHWDVERLWQARSVDICARHPSEGMLPRGWVRRAGLTEDWQQIWQPVTYDHVWLDRIIGDYIAAERALLEATDELDEPAPADQLTA